MRSRPGDLRLGAGAVVVGTAAAVAEGTAPLPLVAVAILAGALALHPRRPTLAWAVAAAATVTLAAEPEPLAVVSVLVIGHAFCAGRYADLRSALGGAATLGGAVLSARIGTDASAVPALLMVGTAWGSGRAIRSRDLVADRLAERAHELDRERHTHAALSVRYERARIAAELHDIVAHAISVMVVQASAGQRLVHVDPELAAETFATIGEAARRAQTDMDQLVALLGDDEAIAPAPDLSLVEELVGRAAGTGLDVTLRLEGPREGLPAAVVQTAYSVVREGMTNALRYAAGSPVRVLVHAETDTLLVEVVNGPARGAVTLVGHGTGNGLRGLRERIDGHGGRLSAGPAADGGWCVSAWLPRRTSGAGRRPS